MTEYIEREAAKGNVKAYSHRFIVADEAGGYGTVRLSEEVIYMEDVDRMLDEIPAADVQPVRHGRWVSVPHKKARICSRCEQDEPYKFADEDANVFDYCPNCGAKMDGGETCTSE